MEQAQSNMYSLANLCMMQLQSEKYFQIASTYLTLKILTIFTHNVNSY